MFTDTPYCYRGHFPGDQPAGGESQQGELARLKAENARLREALRDTMAGLVGSRSIPDLKATIRKALAEGGPDE